MSKIYLHSLIILILCASCAVSYKPITPSLYPYRNKNEVIGDITISYDYDVQGMSNNRRYSNSEKSHQMAAVAIRIENNSDRAVKITKENLLVYKGDNQIMPLTPTEYTKRVKQKAGFHMFHTLWGPWGFSYSSNSNGQNESHVYFIPIGAVVGLANTIKGTNANATHLIALQANEIWDKVILPSEKAYGIILIRGLGYENLRFEFLD